jgi:hypothetical protein
MISKTFKLAILPFLFSLFIWNCNLSDQERDNLLSIKLDDSLSTFDAIRVDILNPDGTVFKDSVFYGKYKPAPDHILKDLNLGVNVPANFKIRITGIRGKVNALVVSINVTPAGVEAPIVLVRVIPLKDSLPPPADTTRPPKEFLPNLVVFMTASPLTLFTTSTVFSLKAEVQPSGANPSLLWTSSDPLVVEVDSVGSVTPKQIGEVDITAKSKRDPTFSAALHIKVIESVVVKGVTVDPTKLELYLGGETQKLKAEVNPSTAGLSILFQSENDSIAQVLADGTVKGIKVGQTGIKAYPVNYPALGVSIPVSVKIDVPKLDVGSDRNAKPKELLAFPISVTQSYGDIGALKWSLDGDKIWDDSTKMPTASPTRAYDGKDSAIMVYFYVRDTEGNIAEASRKVSIGKIGTLAAPVFTSGTTTSPTRQNKPTWAWSGSPSGTGSFQYVLDNLPEATTKNKSFTAPTLTDGEHTFSLRELDSLGNPSDAAVNILKIITQGPVITITSPARATLTKEKSINVIWTVKQLNGTVITNNSPENLVGKQGAIKIIRSDSDAVGNWGIDSIILFRDTIAPSTPTFTTATSPALVNAGYTTPVQWAWNRTGAANDTFQVTLNGAPVHATGTTYALSNPANLSYSLEVREVDSAGNASGPIAFSILVDKIAPPSPIVTGTTPAGNPTWSWIAGTASDGARIYRYKVSTATTYSAESPATSYSPIGLATGSYTLQVQEKDQAGNWSGDGVFLIEVDKTGPSVVVGKPTQMGRVTRINPITSGSVTDANGIKQVQYRLNSDTLKNVPSPSGGWSFAGNFSPGANIVWICAEDKFGNRDSVQVIMFGL